MFNRHSPCFSCSQKTAILTKSGCAVQNAVQNLHVLRLNVQHPNTVACDTRSRQIQFSVDDRACRWHRRCQLEEVATSVRRIFLCS